LVDGSKPIKPEDIEKIAKIVEELQEKPNLIAFNVIIIETTEKSLPEEITKELVPEDKPGQLTSCTTAVECDEVIEEIVTKVPSHEDVTIDLIYYVVIIQNTDPMNGPVKHVTDRFKPLDIKKEIVEYTMDGFVTKWT